MQIIQPTSPTDFSTAISTLPAIEIRSLAPGDDATAFRTLNEEWITRYFTLEAKDRETLYDPVNSILLKGSFVKKRPRFTAQKHSRSIPKIF